MRKIGLIVVAFMGLMVLLPAAPVEAQGIWEGCDEAVSKDICGDKEEASTIAKRIINTFLYAIGVLSVIMIIHSGLKYVTSRGDAEQVKSAKNTLLYSVIGLIVALLAFTIVNFVVGALNTTPSTPAPAQGQTGPTTH